MAKTSKKKALIRKKVTVTIVPQKEPRKTYKKPNHTLPDALRKNVWKPGQSGNPSGRPKGTGAKLLSVAYNACLDEAVPDEFFNHIDYAHLKSLRGKGITWADLVALGQLRSAVGGNTMAAKEIREVTEGKLPDKTELTGRNGEPLAAAPVALNINFVKPKKKEK